MFNWTSANMMKQHCSAVEGLRLPSLCHPMWPDLEKQLPSTVCVKWVWVQGLNKNLLKQSSPTQTFHINSSMKGHFFLCRIVLHNPQKNQITINPDCSSVKNKCRDMAFMKLLFKFTRIFWMKNNEFAEQLHCYDFNCNTLLIHLFFDDNQQPAFLLFKMKKILLNVAKRWSACCKLPSNTI